jgi:hypothetical protein
MSISTKTILGIPVGQVSKTVSVPNLGSRPYFAFAVFKQQMLRRPIALLLTLLSLSSLSTAFAGDNDNTTYVDPNVPKPGNPPISSPPGSPGWTPVAGASPIKGNPPISKPVSVPAGGSILLACMNKEKVVEFKHWTLTLLSLDSDPSDVQKLTATGEGFTSQGDSSSPVEKKNSDGISGWVRPDKKETGPIGTDRMRFQFDIWPQPKWEWAVISNPTASAINFKVVQDKNTCDDQNLIAMAIPGMPNDSAVAMVDNGMFSFAGSADPEAVVEFAYLSQDQDMDTTIPPSWNMPVDSGFWAASYASEYNGIPAPHGAVVFTCVSGPGLQAGEMYTVSFPNPGMSYQKIAFDTIGQEFQEYDIDLRRPLSIASSNNSVALGFNSMLGYNYTVQTTPNLLGTWQPLQLLPGTGNFMSCQEPMVGNAGFFRLACQPTPPVINPPTVIGIGAPANSNALTITFSAPVDPMTATDPNNYFTGGPFGPILIDNISPLGSRAVVLTLGSPLITSSNYFLGVRGVADRNGNVMNPATFPFMAAALQTPCPGGTLLARQTYSVCEPDGFWHVVEDDWYDCPPVTKFRVADTKTDQPCNSAQTPPNPVGLLYCTSADVVSTCQGYNTAGPITVCTGLGGLWQASSYIQDQCMDGTLYLDGPIETVPMNPPTSCGATPPLSPAPQ